MAAYREAKVWWVVLLSLLELLLSRSEHSVYGKSRVDCFYIFGDSLVDNGNNNLLTTSAKANYPPYGIDFPNAAPTGRFTNNLTTSDIIGQLLGFARFIPPFRTAIASGDILIGVNYASGSAGIRYESGRQLGDNLSFDEQLQNHRITISRLVMKLGSVKSTNEYLNKCLYSVGFGSNDYLNNYFMPNIYPTSRIYNPDQYAGVLIDQYSRQLRTLYGLGARKIALNGIGLLGCTPYAISKFGTNGSACVDNINTAVQLFNGRLKSLVDALNNELQDAKFIYINIFGMSSGDPSAAGFAVVNVGCCPVRSDGQCVEDSTPCPNRNEYMYWDSFHPTDALNQITAIRSYTASEPSDAYPYDISHLVAMS